MNKNILLTGGTGLIGNVLSKKLLDKGNNVGILTRQNKKSERIKYFNWDYTLNKIDKKAIDFADIIINLVGANIGDKKWTTKQKNIIIDSRVKSINLLASELEKNEKKIDAFISASAIGYYGTTTTDKIYKETDKSGNDFLSEVVVKWENAIEKIIPFADRVVKLRIGVVLSKDGGALPKMLNITKKGLGSAIGTGNQFMPWISLEDLSNMIIFSTENNNITGIYNAVSPEHVANKDFMNKLAKSLNKPFFMPNVPSFVLKTVFGEMSSLLLEGSRVSADKIINSGFKFKHSLDSFLNEIK